tara:strand:- start:149 stop:1585 length:1437 start_codon:yes stop_codon:yes gene_type:complete
MSATIEVKYFNSFLLRKTVDAATKLAAYKPASTNEDLNWIIEESRIKGGFNETSVSLGVRAYLVADSNKGIIRSNSLIYSGIFNSRTGINQTNQFPVGENITRSLNPAQGSIQKLYAEDTNLIVFQELKVSRALIDKDAIYSAEGQALTTSGSQIIGQIIPYAGEYGISQNPESFAVFGYRKYFSDKNKNCILRLSKDGLTEISSYGMRDYFRDELNELDNSNSEKGRIVGGWDIHTKSYVLSLQRASGGSSNNTLAFDEKINGWVSFYSYTPQFIFSIKNAFYSIPTGKLVIGQSNNLFQHYTGSYDTFYNVTTPANVTFVFNPKVSMSKNFNTIGYEGTNGWKLTSLVSDAQQFDTFTGGTNRTFVDIAKPISSYEEGAYIVSNDVLYQSNDPSWFSLVVQGNSVFRSGFDRKENKFVANIINDSSSRPEEIIFGNKMSGIKGLFATATLSVDNTTNPTGKKELYAVSSNYVESSY